jgi:beta-glucosidase
MFLQLNPTPMRLCTLGIQASREGSMDGDEVVQAYIQYPNLGGMPLKELKAFKRIFVAKGKGQIVQLKIPLQ